MAALIAAGAFFHLSIGPVPVTFQDLFVALAGLVLGPRYGVYAVALYILAGCAGLPVFSGGRAGVGHLIGPTGGYFLGFLCLAFCAGAGGRLAGKDARGRDNKRNGKAQDWRRMGTALAGVLAGLFFLYLCGVVWLAAGLHFSPAQAVAVGVIPFLPMALCKMALSVVLWRILFRRGLLPA